MPKDTRPLLVVIAGRPVVANSTDRVAQARLRHGKPFSTETGSTWKPHEASVLTEWLQKRGRT